MMIPPPMVLPATLEFVSVVVFFEPLRPPPPLFFFNFFEFFLLLLLLLSRFRRAQTALLVFLRVIKQVVCV